ncbi:MAG: IS66 family transposase [Calditrichaeota bacterium]|nr:IS66 family transposase [Calditrichota bacterium]
MNKIITSQIVVAYSLCPHKAFLLLEGKEKGKLHEYVEILEEQRKQNRGDYLNTLREKNTAVAFTEERMRDRSDLLIDAVLRHGDLQAYCDSLTKVKTSSSLGRFSYEPTVVIGAHKVTKEDKIELSFAAFILGEMQGTLPASGTIIAMGEKRQRPKLESHYKTVTPAIETLRDLITPPLSQRPPVILNKHCPYCPFRDECKEEAREKDHLSLLQRISPKEIEKHNNRGIFTVTQLAFTYRPRKQRKSKGKIVSKYYHSLKALAIRGKKIYVVNKPEIPSCETMMFFDVEGDPDRDLYYLIGVIICRDGSIEERSFWADNEEEEENIWRRFIELIGQYSDFILFHYGSYEMKFIENMNKKYGTQDRSIIERISRKLVNVLSLMYSNIYFPTYSNSLKDIAGYLGYSWSEKDASGLQSLVWRNWWERTEEEDFKQRLITYNREDNSALKRVTEAVSRISSKNEEERTIEPFEIASIEDLKVETPFKFGTNKFLIEELEFINKCAYFDYQRERVFFREEKTKVNSKRRKKKVNKIQINKRVEIETEIRCPRCGNDDFYKHDEKFKTVYDLFYLKYGIKRWVVEYHAYRSRCKSCNKTFAPKEFLQIKGKYGNQLMVWVVYQIVALRQTYNKIIENLQDTFDYHLHNTICSEIKKKMAKNYKISYEKILNNLVNGNLIHADETPCKIKGNTVFVWIFTNYEEVAFVYTPTREGDILTEVLRDFNGVLVSDFYSAYDSFKGPQQKCLIHLIRDMNDDLRNNPFDEEYKILIKDFSELIKEIIVTVDRFGLKKRNLNKHKKQVDKFFKAHLTRKYTSHVAISYQTKFQKYQNKLFTFLDYDRIPWNNNNAEHAIKSFAMYRKINDNFYSEKGMKDYLILFSIYQTCVYKEIDFLRFLRSGETDIDRFIRNKR